MTNYQEARVKIRNTQLNKSKSAAKSKTGTILKLNRKNVEDEELPHELFLTTVQTTQIRNAFANHMSTNIKPNKTQISKIIQSGGSFVSWLGNLEKKALTNIALSLSKNNFLRLVSNLTSNAINKFEKQNKWKKSCESRKRIYFFYFE